MQTYEELAKALHEIEGQLNLLRMDAEDLNEEAAADIETATDLVFAAKNHLKGGSEMQEVPFIEG